MKTNAEKTVGMGTMSAETKDATVSSAKSASPHTVTSHIEKPLNSTLKDPLLKRPRWSAIIWSAVLGVLLLLAGAGAWWLTVRTLAGQQLDTIIWTSLPQLAPRWLRIVAPVITSKYVIDGFCVVCGLIAVALAVVRRRWVLIVQMVIFVCAAVGVHLLKYVLPRPVIDSHLPNPSNTSPSGHTMAIATAVILLVMACGLLWRAWVSVFALVVTGVVATCLVIAQWHRPSDVIVSLLLTGGLALITFAFSRESGLDEPGKRASSPSIQIISTLLLVVGVMAMCVAGYTLSQLWSGLSTMASWVSAPACRAAVFAIFGVDCFVFALVLICRQSTASPLSAIGLLGGPPKPDRAAANGSANDDVSWVAARRVS